MSQPLWKPSSRRIEQANLTRFTGYVADRWGIRCPDYAALHHWSIEQPAQFWLSVWDFCGVIGDIGSDTVLENEARMPGARWFPAARLNYVENLLHRRTPESALIFHGEDQVRRELSWSDLYHQVSRLAGALRALGVREGGVAYPEPQPLPAPDRVRAAAGTTGFTDRRIPVSEGDRIPVCRPGGTDRRFILIFQRIECGFYRIEKFS